MLGRILYYIITLMLAALAIYCMAHAKPAARKKTYTFRKDRKASIRSLIKIRSDEKEYNKLFITAGLNIDIYQYHMVRYTAFILLTILFIITNRFNFFRLLSINYLIFLLLFLLTTPKKEFMGKKTPFVMIMDLLTAKQLNRINLEISRAISQLKNLTMTRRDNPPSALFIFEQLRKYTKTLRPVFNRMISLYNENKKDEAEKYFIEAVGTKESETLANLLMKLDSLTPAELRTQLTVYQENIKKERETAKLKNIERRSYLIYFVVILSSFIMLLNFIIVVYTIDSMELLKFMR